MKRYGISKWIVGWIVLMWSIGGIVASGLSAGVTLSALRQVQVSGSGISIGDIAVVAGDDSELVRRIQEISLGNAPILGASRSIDKSYIEIRLRQNRIDPNGIAILVPDTIDIVRKSFEIPKTRIERIVLDYLEPRLPWDRNKTRIGLSSTSDVVNLSDEDFQAEVSLPNRTNLIGSVPLLVRFLVKHQVERKIWVTATISVETSVVIAKQSINRRQVITEDMIDVVAADLAKLPSNAITDLEDVVGKRALRAINPSEVLRTDLIELPPLVKRNDIVTIVAETGALRVSTKGEVKENGRRGDRIRVVNLDSKKEVFARVLDPTTVRVEF